MTGSILDHIGKLSMIIKAMKEAGIKSSITDELEACVADGVADYRMTVQEIRRTTHALPDPTADTIRQ